MSLWGLLRDPQEAMPSFEENLTARLAQAPSSDTDPPETDLEYYAKPENYTGSNIHSIQRFVQKQRKHVPESSAPVRADDSEIYNIVPAVTKPLEIIEDEDSRDESSSPESVRKQRPRSASLRSSSIPEIKTKISEIRRKSLSAPRPKTTDGLAIKQAFNVNTAEVSYSAPAGRRMSRMLDSSLSRLPDSGQTTGRSRSSRISRVSQMFESPKIADALKAQLARERFRRAIRLVQHALKWLSNIAKKSESDEQMMSTFTDMATSNARDEELTFDPSYFKAKKEINISQEVQYILSLPPSDRTQDQLQTALYGLQHLRSFAEYPLHMQEKLCRVAWFEKVPPKRVIIRQGHIAENFYFILSGSAVVKILEKNPKTGETHQRMATIMRKGMSFGELALLHHSKRTATVVSQDTVQLLTIGRDDFFDIFMSGQGPGEIPEHIKFISTLDFMQEWPIEKLVEHPEQCLFHFFKRGVVIVKDSTKSDWLYIVKSGSCQVMKQLKGVTAKLGLRNKPCEGATDIWLPQLGTGESDCKVDTGRKRRHPKTPRSNRRCLTALQEVEIERYLEDGRTRSTEPEGFRAKSENGNASDPNAGFSHSRYRRLPTTNKPHFVHSTMMEPKKAWASRTPQATKPRPSKQEKALDPVFVQIELLKPRDVFGLTTLIFDNEIATSQTSVNLVSRGAECIMLSKKFFTQHATDNVRRMVRHQVQPYPNEATLQENLQIKADWELYKRSLTQRITHRS